MATKLQLEERVIELEEQLEEIYAKLGQLLDLEQEEDDSTE